MDILPEPENRGVTSHIGAALADSILQAGLRYDTVVSGRVRRIVELFPEATTVSGTIDALSAHGPRHFLSWTHRCKIVRFTGLLCHIHAEAVETCADLHTWLDTEEARQSLLTLTGIGPKTVDYLCSLVGLDCVAVDRHMRKLSQLAGIEQTDYSELKLVISYAADLMNVPRRKFDWWLWRVMSQNDKERGESSLWLANIRRQVPSSN
jgi:3-methyladenine DNA glycosylase/8-oxoguanine DNA glycosylase